MELFLNFNTLFLVVMEEDGAVLSINSTTSKLVTLIMKTL